jgi:hypothetical protein
VTEPADVATVDPRGPRFGRAVTATLAGAGVVLAEPLLVAAVAGLLGTAVLSRWRIDVVAMGWRRLAVPIVGASAEREPATPHRFAKFVGAVLTVTATPLLLVGGSLATVGYPLAAVVTVLAALGATTGVLSRLSDARGSGARPPVRRRLITVRTASALLAHLAAGELNGFLPLDAGR